MSSNDNLPLSKNYIAYLPRRLQQEGNSKISQYMSKLKKLDVPLPTSV
jgi:hypothetical protein